MIILTAPACSGLWSKEDDIAGHFRRYSLNEINTLLIESGYTVEFISYFFSILVLPIFLFRTIPTVLGLYKRANIGAHKSKRNSLNSILSVLLGFEEKRFRKLKKKSNGE